MDQLKYMYACRLCGKQFHSATAAWNDANIKDVELAVANKTVVGGLWAPQILHNCSENANNRALGVADFIGIKEF